MLEIVGIVAWLSIQTLLTVRLISAVPKKEVLFRYPTRVRMRLLAPVSLHWERLVDPGDREQFALCRKWLGLWQLNLLVFTILFVAYVRWLASNIL